MFLGEMLKREAASLSNQYAVITSLYFLFYVSINKLLI